MRLRRINRIGAIGLLAAGAVALVPAPAFAAGTDLGVNLTGVSLAADAPLKLAILTITNNGTTTPAAVDVRFDTTGLDTSKVTMAEPDPRCRTGNGITTCRLGVEDIPGPGRSTKLPVPMERVTDAGGAAGHLTVTVAVAGDTDRADNSATADVTVADSKVDLSVYAGDVGDAGDIDAGELVVRPIAPGAVGLLFAAVMNQGDTTAAGIKVDVTLPEHSTVAEPVDGCEQSADKRSLSCVLDDVTLVPFIKAEQVERAALFFAAPVRVAPDAPGPVALQGGVVSAIALGHEARVARRAKAEALPGSFSRPSAAELAAIDADPTDNADRFAVLVAGRADAGDGTGQVDGGQAAGGQVDGGQVDGGQAAGGQVDGGQAGGVQSAALPVTGPALPLVAGGGVAAAALGVLLYVVARQRRVRLLAPDDGK